MSVVAARTTILDLCRRLHVGIGIRADPGFVYTGASVAEVFFITAATFGAMSLYGYTTRRDLSGFGSFLFMGLIGIVIASRREHVPCNPQMMQWVVSIIRRADLHWPHGL